MAITLPGSGAGAATPGGADPPYGALPAWSDVSSARICSPRRALPDERRASGMHCRPSRVQRVQRLMWPSASMSHLVLEILQHLQAEFTSAAAGCCIGCFVPRVVWLARCCGTSDRPTYSFGA
eukprot:3345497-Prymnesium_polylepis.1